MWDAQDYGIPDRGCQYLLTTELFEISRWHGHPFTLALGHR